MESSDSQSMCRKAIRPSFCSRYPGWPFHNYGVDLTLSGYYNMDNSSYEVDTMAITCHLTITLALLANAL